MPNHLRGALAAFVASAALALAACSNNDSVRFQPGPTPTPAPTATPTTAPPPVSYVAIGASDAVGLGASVPCATPPTVANPTCPGGTGYVPVLAGLITTKTGAAVTLDDLGISGAVVGPDILALTNQYGSQNSAAPCAPRTGADVVPGDFITNELPNVPATATLVTIFAGGNDTNGIVNALGCGAGGTTSASQTAFITTWITNFGNDLQSLIAQVRAKAPNAKIVLANLPNFSQIPVGLAIGATNPAAGQALAAVSVGIDQNVIDRAPSFGIPVVDLLCNPVSYASSNFFTDGFHPNDAGYQALAQAFYAQISAVTPALPQPNCSYASLTARVRLPMSGPIRTFEHR